MCLRASIVATPHPLLRSRMRRRSKPAIPTTPVPSSTNDPGSGVAALAWRHRGQEILRQHRIRRCRRMDVVPEQILVGFAQGVSPGVVKVTRIALPRHVVEAKQPGTIQQSPIQSSDRCRSMSRPQASCASSSLVKRRAERLAAADVVELRRQSQVRQSRHQDVRRPFPLERATILSMSATAVVTEPPTSKSFAPPHTTNSELGNQRRRHLRSRTRQFDFHSGQAREDRRWSVFLNPRRSRCPSWPLRTRSRTAAHPALAARYSTATGPFEKRPL